MPELTTLRLGLQLRNGSQFGISFQAGGMSSSTCMNSRIAIIGAGLSGLALALALHKNGFTNITIYELRPASLDIGGAIMLSPNALRILDALDVYYQLRLRSYEFDTDNAMTPVDTFEFGSASKYGYQALRVYRYELIEVLHNLTQEKDGIFINYDKKFARITSETSKEVTWSFTDDTQASTSFLIGADGIHSQVRKYLYPDLVPRFTKGIGVTAAVPTAQLQLPEGLSTPLTFMNNDHGAFVITKQLHDGSEVLIGKQRRFTDNLDKDGWADLLNNKQWCIDFLRQGASDFPPVVSNAVSNISKERINLWPFYIVPKLNTWVSERGNVVILGDAAHAIPPTAGQGVKQAFEDVYTFAGVLGALEKQHTESGHTSRRNEIFKRWQIGRQARIDKVLELNAMIDKRRLPNQDSYEIQKGEFDLNWLYNIDFERTISEWAV
ncbi:salicylate hydroxylase, putative [Talaromyces stipitatus ATCC 10500]|uniref:Salicylate hydroxylase, putative n=1 Tax=Talaromyces stipitatus (strain ATCC 10500 / CBS 375.48 / QM 6759 / NRRL 1006) TaxID=441959 RepID=B8MMP3_TALSN|nr:salicylate hydroxylase, putative [Talaromyces stipitatus ATCC 10500]EED13610.1 salicylate hydroxylase, putative [Talaromyces stipitatus ATCC 10500]